MQDKQTVIKPAIETGNNELSFDILLDNELSFDILLVIAADASAYAPQNCPSRTPAHPANPWIDP